MIQASFYRQLIGILAICFVLIGVIAPSASAAAITKGQIKNTITEKCDAVRDNYEGPKVTTLYKNLRAACDASGKWKVKASDISRAKRLIEICNAKYKGILDEVGAYTELGEIPTHEGNCPKIRTSPAVKAIAAGTQKAEADSTEEQDFGEVDLSPIASAGIEDPGQDSLDSIINIVFGIAGGLALIFVVVGGFRYIISRGEPAAVAQGKNTIIYALVGLVVTIFAYAIVRFAIGVIF